MSMWDKSWCNCDCLQKDCERNLKFNTPQERYFSVATFDENNADIKHKSCKWKILKK